MNRIITIVAVLSLFMTGCNEKPLEMDAPDKVDVSDEIINAGPDGGPFEITVTSSEDWRVSGKCDWVSVSSDGGKSGNTLTFNVDKNEGGNIRQAEFKIFAGSAVKSISVISSPSYEVELLSDAAVSLSTDGGIVRVELNTNIRDLEVTYNGNDSEWIALEAITTGLGLTVYTFNISETQLYVERKGDILIGNKDGKSVKVSVVQDKIKAILADITTLEYNDIKERDIEMTIRHNVEYVMTLPEWITETDKKQGETADGLTSVTYKFHIDKAATSRSGNISFHYNDVPLLVVSVKQTNPNAVFIDIEDEKLAEYLVALGWVTLAEGTRYDVLESGLTATSLNIAAENNWGTTTLKIKTVDCLGAFKELTSLSFYNCNVETVDLSDNEKISNIKFEYCQSLTALHFGNNHITEFKFAPTPDEYSNYLKSKSFTISGKHIEIVDMNSKSDALGRYDKCEVLDVTGCPALKVLKAKREGGWPKNCPLKTIYVTAEQKAAIAAGTLTVEKSDKTTIEVKN